MAKRSIRKTDPADTTAPASRRRTTAGATGEKPAARPRRTTAAAPAVVAADTTLVAVEADIENGEEVAASVLSHEQIAERAYHIYLERSKKPGDQLLDWVTAERQLREQFSRAR